MKSEEKILLYWSGEADDDLSREVEFLLETETWARDYLKELGELALGLDQVREPVRREGLLEEVLKGQRKEVILFPKRLILGGGLAAAVAIGVGWMVMNSENPNREEGLAENEVDREDVIPQQRKVRGISLSERILSSSEKFGEGRMGISQVRRNRERWRKIRIIENDKI